MRLLLLGGTGRLGRHVAALDSPALRVHAPTRQQLDLATADLGLVADHDAVLNCAAAANVDACERDPALADRLNTDLPRRLAAACAAASIPLLHTSTDYVFGGPARPEGPFAESDLVDPAQHYGVSKARGEAAVLERGGHVARVSWLFADADSTFARFVLSSPSPVPLFDQASRPTYVPALARWLVDVCGRLRAGLPTPSILHPAGGPAATREEWARAILDAHGRRATLDVSPAPSHLAPRPTDSRLDATSTDAWLATTDIAPLPDWRDALRTGG